MRFSTDKDTDLTVTGTKGTFVKISNETIVGNELEFPVLSVESVVAIGETNYVLTERTNHVVLKEA